MTDSRLQELKRAWEASGSVEDEAAYLRERVRVGDLTQERLELAAYCGHEGAMAAAGRQCANLASYGPLESCNAALRDLPISEIGGERWQALVQKKREAWNEYKRTVMGLLAFGTDTGQRVAFCLVKLLEPRLDQSLDPKGLASILSACQRLIADPLNAEPEPCRALVSTTRVRVNDTGFVGQAVRHLGAAITSTDETLGEAHLREAVGLALGAAGNDAIPVVFPRVSVWALSGAEIV